MQADWVTVALLVVVVFLLWEIRDKLDRLRDTLIRFEQRRYGEDD